MTAAGVAGTMYSRNQNSYKLNRVNMILSIAGSLVGLTNFAVFASEMVHFSRLPSPVSDNCQYHGNPTYSSARVYYSPRCMRNQISLGLHAVIVLSGLAEFIIGMVAAATCCSVLCQCKQRKKPEKCDVEQPMMTKGNGQSIMGTGQPVMMTSSEGQPIMILPSQMLVHYSMEAGQPMMYYTGQQAMYMPLQPQVVYSQKTQPHEQQKKQPQGGETNASTQGDQEDAPPEYQDIREETAPEYKEIREDTGGHCRETIFSA